MEPTAFLLIILVSLGLGACTRKAPPSVAETPAIEQTSPSTPGTATPGVTTKTTGPARDESLLHVVKMSVQADQILREAWWVVANDRRPASRSAFGKLQRAAMEALDGKLMTKGIFQGCDHYQMKKESQLPWKATFFEACGKNVAPKEIAIWSFNSGTASTRGEASVEFFSQNLGEVLGLSASVFGRRMRCQIWWDEKGALDRLSCPNWEQDREKQLVRLTTFEYKREGGALLTLKGQVLENLQAVRKIESEVPMDGKIVVTETELNPPPPEAAKEPDPKTLKQVRKGAPTAATPPANSAPAAGRGRPVVPPAANPAQQPGQMAPMDPSQGVFFPQAPIEIPEGYEVVPVPPQMPPQEDIPMEPQQPLPSEPTPTSVPGR